MSEPYLEIYVYILWRGGSYNGTRIKVASGLESDIPKSIELPIDHHLSFQQPDAPVYRAVLLGRLAGDIYYKQTDDPPRQKGVE